MIETIPGKRLFCDERILWHNRAYPEYAKVQLDLTLSGFSVTVEGEELLAEIDADANLHFAVFCDGRELPRVVTQTRGVQKVTFARYLSPYKHRIDVFRLTEQSSGRSAILSLTARCFLEKPQEKKELITFYGDSITCAYGNEGAPEEGYRPETQNPLLGYAYLLCKERNADWDVFAYSGISVSEKIFVPEYTLGDICFGHSMYNRTRYLYPRKSDIVIVNIGTNDASAITNGIGTEKGLEEGLYRFVCRVIEKHPEAKIVLTSGFIDRIPTQGAVTDAAFDRLNREYPGRMLRFVFPFNNRGANGHPDVEGHKKGAAALAAFLAEKVPAKGETAKGATL